MSFAENLKQIRKENYLSQEELAELLDVSRQAVSKWEQGMGYPEVEKLLLLSSKLHVSLDALLSTEFAGSEGAKPANVTGTIVITSPSENVITTCYKVRVSRAMGGKRSPKYALIGVDRGGSSFWGESSTMLGWYADQESVAKEMEAIQAAISQGLPMYTLQFSVKTESRRWGSRIVEE